jgi:hypothetical protein
MVAHCTKSSTLAKPFFALRADRATSEVAERLEVARAADLISIVMSGAIDDMKHLGWLRGFIDLAPQFKRNNIVPIAVNDQFRKGKRRESLD